MTDLEEYAYLPEGADSDTLSSQLVLLLQDALAVQSAVGDDVDEIGCLLAHIQRLLELTGAMPCQP